METIQIFLPSIIILGTFATAYLLIKDFLKKEITIFSLQMKKEHTQYSAQVKLEAFEKLTVFLEKISLENLISFSNKENSSGKLQMFLLQFIRDEYSQILSKQIYISYEVWQYIKNAKEITIKIVNTAAMELDSNSHSIELSKKIAEKLMQAENTPSKIAIDKIKSEIKTNFPNF